MRKALYISLTLVAMVILITCKKLYNPKVVDAGAGYLVVEGLINSGADSTIIKLSRTGKIYQYYANNATANEELKAIVAVEDDQGKSMPLKEAPGGKYVSAGLNLDVSRNYHLRITTADGQVYLSDNEAVKVSPPIDSLGYKISNTGVDIYANAHDGTNNTRYYRWEFEETWQFQVAYNSSISGICDAPPHQPVSRTQSLYTCFASDVPGTIILGSTAKLAQDVLYQAPITTIPGSSEKISIRYSILVKQYALTKQSYEFWTNLKKNTESLGSIFDAQPSTAPGNIHCISDASLPAVGYISVGTVQNKRIFIDKTDVRGFVTIPPNVCGTSTVMFTNSGLCYPSGNNIIVDLVYAGSDPVGFTQTSRACADCTTRGVLKQPPFWK